MSANLSDAQVGDVFRVHHPVVGVTYEARIIQMDEDHDERLIVVVDYVVIGPVEDLPAPWNECDWEKVQ